MSAFDFTNSFLCVAARTFSRGLLLVVACGAFAATAHAQFAWKPVTISGTAGPLSSAEAAFFTLAGKFEPSSPGAGDAAYNFHQQAPAYSTSGLTVPSTTLRMIPGKRYALFIDAGDIGVFTLNLTVPAGYQLEIDGVAQNGWSSFNPPNPAFYSQEHSLRLVDMSTVPGNTVPIPAGVPGNLGTTGVYWEVGLGALLNGGSAGTLQISDSAGESSWSHLFAPGSLDYRPPSAETAVYPTSGPIRQIVANETVVNVVTNAQDSSVATGTYQIRFYHPGQKTGSSYPYGFNGKPFATYTVEQGTSGTSLKITHEARDLTGLTDTSVSVSRTMATSITRAGTWPEFNWTRKDWHVASGSPATEAYTASVGTASARTETTQLRLNGGSGVAEVYSRSFVDLPSWGERESGSTRGTTNQESSTLDTWTTGAATGTYGFLKSRKKADAEWEAYEYYASSASDTGRIKRIYRPFGETASSVPSSFSSSSGEVTYFTYSADAFGLNNRPAVTETSVDGTLVSRSETTYGTDTGPASLTLVVATREDRVSSNSADKLTTVTKYFSESVSDAHFRGMLHSLTRPDNVKIAYAYQRGSWSGSAFTASSGGGTGAGTASRTVVITGTTNSSHSSVTAYDGYDVDDLYVVTGKSTAEVTIRDSRALVVRTETRAWNGSDWATVSSVDYTYNLNGRLEIKEASNGAKHSFTYLGDRKATETDETGVVLSYSYDAAGRVEVVSKGAGGPLTSALKTKFVYDAASRVTQQIFGPDPDNTSTERLITNTAYDNAGRLQSVQTPGLGVTTITYNPAARTRTITAPAPDSGTKIETLRGDGRLGSITGTSVVAQHYGYTVESNGQRRTQVNFGSSTSPRWTKSWNDWLGRPVKSERPGFSPSSRANFIEENFYDDATIGKGRLYKVTRTGYAPTRYEYDALSRVIRSGLDVNDNGLVLASDDRITDANTAFETIVSSWWLVSTTTIYPTSNSATGYTTTKRSRLTGLASGRLAEEQEIDLDLNVVTRTTDVSRSSKVVTVATEGPCNCSIATQTMINGYLMETVTRDGLTFDTDYDALGRKIHDVDPRTGTVTTAYVSGTTQVYSVKDAANNFISRAGYDTSGRQAWVQNANDAVVRFAYNARSQVTHQWGSAAYPVAYGYDSAYGDRTSMNTYRGGSNWDAISWPTSTTGTADPTTWEFDANSGLLWKKTDAGSQVVEFDYNTRGQIETRKWARLRPDLQDKLSTTYLYSSTTGELTSVDYNDSTPDVGYTYNRLGQLGTVSDYVGTRTFVQNTSAPWRNEREAFPAFYDSRWLTRAYDVTTGTGSTLGSHTLGTFAGRYAGYDLGNSGDSDADLRVRQVYSNQQRFAAVRATVGSGTQQDFIYAYEANSRLIDGYVTGSNFAVSRDYESARDLVSRLETKWGTTTLTRFDYTHTAAGQRKTAQQRGTAFADYYTASPYSPAYTSVFNHYSYNARGELESAAMYRGDTIPAVTSSPNSTDELPGRRFEYRYDSIGNRKTSGQTGSAGTADDEYTTDARNRYTARENNTVRITGSAAATATVAVAGASSTNKKDSAWAADIVPANSGAASKGSATVYAALVGGGSGGADLIKTLGTPSWFVPAAAQSFTYDEDGNLTTDGVWTYNYDAENRLIAMEHRSEAIGTGKIAPAHARRLEFRYDYQGRRVMKTVRRGWNGSSYATWDSTRKFLYDGWNVVAEFSLPSEDSSIVTLTRSYHWGLDLAGSLGATGGVGALLQMRDHGSGKTYWPAYDGNGNVMALVNASNGDLAAVYEYDPFGQPIRSETLDSTVADNPWRFSTKFTDMESGLVYYGHRYYSATLGRFINRDPIGEEGGLNLYAFASNDSINGIDFLGMVVVCVGLDSPTQCYFDSLGRFVCIPKGPQQYRCYEDGLSVQPVPDDTGSIGSSSATLPSSQNAQSVKSDAPNNAENPACDELRAALKYARLAKAGYPGEKPPAGWSEVDAFGKFGIPPDMMDRPGSGYGARVFQNDSTGEYVGSFAGTDQMVDWTDANIPQNFALSSDQYRSATMFGNVAGRAMPGIVFVGHSLGGGLASAALGNSSRAGGAYIFNAAGLNPGTLARYGGSYDRVSANTQHWYYTSDPLTSAQARLGSGLLAPAAGNWNAIIDRTGNGSLLYKHSINTLINGIEGELSKLGCK